MSLAQPLTFSQRRLTTRLSLTICVTLFAVVPAAAEHRARLSADLADHLAAGSQSIDVIVHGDARGGGRAGRPLQPHRRAVSEERRRAARERRSARRAAARPRRRSSLRRHPAAAVDGDHQRGDDRRRPGLGRRRRHARPDRPRRHRGGDRLGDQRPAQRAARGA